MKNTFRQSMSWLHTWSGLLLGWVLITIFVTGTLTVFSEAITHWMQPELFEHDYEHRQEEASRPEDLSKFIRIAAMQAEINKHRNEHTQWARLELSSSPQTDRYYWWQTDKGEQKADGSHRGALGGLVSIDKATAAAPIEEEHVDPITRDSDGGRFFVNFHFSLTHDGQKWGLWTVFVSTLVFIIASVSGVVVHKKIFKDFFTFRPGKGQRSWLDIHNASAVLSIPFLLMIAYTGIVIILRFGVEAPNQQANNIYENFFTADDSRYFKNVENNKKRLPSTDDTPTLTHVATLAEKIEKTRPVEVTNIGLYDLNTVAPTLNIFTSPIGKSTFSGQAFHFNALSGELLDIKREHDPGVFYGTMYNLHLLKGAADNSILRWFYFISSALGSIMMAAGVILFMVKRRKRAENEFGRATTLFYKMTETLNIAAVSGLSIACIGYFWLNRLIPVELPDGWEERHHLEADGFIYVWLFTLLHAAIRVFWRGEIMRAWVEQLAFLSIACLLLPLLNIMTTDYHWLRYLREGDWQAFGVELTVCVFGLLFALVAIKVQQKRTGPAIETTKINRRNLSRVSQEEIASE